MKKRNYLLQFVIYFGLFFLVFTAVSHAQVGGIEDVEKAGDTITDLAEGNYNQSYLGKEWTDLVREKAPWIYSLDPVFQFLFAYRFEFSWAFVAAFLLWTIQFAFYYPPINMVVENTPLSLAISAILAALSSQLIVPRAIVFMANFVKNIWANILLIILLVIILAVLFQSSSLLTKKWQKIKEKRRIKKLEEEAGKSRAMRKGVESMRRGADAGRKGYDKRHLK